ncbi:bystin [Eupeodes corollae]|uniref:bystin n=1 Tax=Eupeodes corollae TaxID=290404 RepID=UPI0024905779|nr:bystin [Eupeodes corollae]
MGKAKKINKVNSKSQVPLDKQMTQGKVVKKNRDKLYLRAEEHSVVDSRTSKKILQAAKQQQLDLNEENFPDTLGAKRKTTKFNLGPSLSGFGDDDDDDDDRNEVTADDFMDDLKIDDDDTEAFERFQNSTSAKRTLNLSEIIKQKIAEKQGELQSKLSDQGSLKIEDIDKRVLEMYEGVRDVMKRYKSGKVPKAFKIIPKLRNWEQILFITEPHNWSAAAMFQGTRIFCSILSQSMAQRFYNLVLLPRVRDDLSEYKKLNVHLYNALKRALFKPAAFMKGIILPLLESGDCTLREAIIFGSIVSKNRIPVLHSAACLLKICEMGYTGANSIFIRIFLEKRYALPYRVVDAAVFHFLRFEQDKRVMPVLWHQSLLTFAQRYKNDISSEQKEALLGLLKTHAHPKIGPEVRRELQSAVCRDIEGMECDNAKGAVPMEQYTDEDVNFS